MGFRLSASREVGKIIRDGLLHIVGLGLSMGFVDSKKNIEQQQPYPLKILILEPPTQFDEHVCKCSAETVSVRCEDKLF